MYTPSGTAPQTFIRFGSNLVRADDIRGVGIRATATSATGTTPTLIIEFYGESSTMNPLTINLNPGFQIEVLNYCQDALNGDVPRPFWNHAWEVADNTAPASPDLDQKHPPVPVFPPTDQKPAPEETVPWYIRPGHRIRFQDYVAKSWVPGNVISVDAETRSAKIQCPSVNGGEVIWAVFGRIAPVKEDLHDADAPTANTEKPAPAPPAHIRVGNQVRYQNPSTNGNDWITATVEWVHLTRKDALLRTDNYRRWVSWEQIQEVPIEKPDQKHALAPPTANTEKPALATPPVHIRKGNQVRFWGSVGKWILATVGTIFPGDQHAHLIYDDGYGPCVPFKEIYPVLDSATRENPTTATSDWLSKKVLVLPKNSKFTLEEGIVTTTVKYHNSDTTTRDYVVVKFGTTTTEEIPMSAIYAVLEQPQTPPTTV